MELSPNIISGLKPLGNSTLFSEDVYNKLLNSTFGCIIGRKKISNVSQLSQSKADTIKAAFPSLMSLLIEASRNNIDADCLTTVLIQECNFPPSRTDKLVSAYQNNKTKIQAALSLIGNHPPHAIDVHWTLDFCIKSSSAEHVGKPQYLIQLSTESCVEGDKVIKFMCSSEELQDLVAKLKDASRVVEKMANLSQE